MYFMVVWIAQARITEAAWNYKSGRHSALSSAFFISVQLYTKYACIIDLALVTHEQLVVTCSLNATM